MTIRILSPGASTTVQDLGRPGFGASGVPPSGAMDQLSLRAANLLAGNQEDAAALEITLRGPELLFEEDHRVSVAGAPFEVRVSGDRIDSSRPFVVPNGATLSIGATPVGLRCYLAVEGGFDVPVVLGSRSTFVAGGFGGIDGRPLEKENTLEVGMAGATRRVRMLGPGALPELARETLLRAVPGPQQEAFTRAGLQRFFSIAWRVSPRSDRVGVRLEGEPIEPAGPADIDPEGVVTGAVQVPADGSPILLGPDRPATGGYAKIATVISADLPLLAQARPGDTLRFVETLVEEAREAWRERVKALRRGVAEI